ncbi:hypothetical protein HYS94_00800 [Candidatus Daviesbacteria bacterium]|nr:hypothetical protein [Candidatus Daviesbacteria bacterium]
MKFPRLSAIRLSFLIVIQLVKRKKIWLLAILGLVIVLILAVLVGIFSPKQILREGMVGTYQQHDLPVEIVELASDGLVEMDENGQIQPKLVEGWDVNNDATIFKFKLKQGVRWIDGTDIKSEDLAFDIANTEVTYPDSQTIQFKLKEAYSPFPSLLVRPVFKKGTLIGTGPYKITKVEKSRIFITKLSLDPQIKDLPQIQVRFYPNDKVALTGFNVGEVQSLLGIPNPDNLQNNPQLKRKQMVDFKKIVTIIYNTQDPLLSSRSLRQALSFQAPLVEGEDVANNPYPRSWWVYAEDAKKYLNNPEEAKEALERAQSSLSEEQLKGELILTTTPNLEEMAKIIVLAWKGLGFDAKLRIESGIPQNFQALLITQSIPDDPDQYFLWHSSQTKTNLSKYSQARADKDLEDGRRVINEEERKKIYHDFQATILEDAPATFLYFPKYHVVYLKKVESLLDKVLNMQLAL